MTNENIELTKKEKYTLDIKDIAKVLRKQLKTEYPGCTFSVCIKRFSGQVGQALDVSLMASGFKIIRDFDDIPDYVVSNYGDTRGFTIAEVKARQARKYHQLHNFNTHDEYDPKKWNNGVYLTRRGFDMFKRISEMVRWFNYDDSDIMTDYFDMNFFSHLNIGKWNQEYELIT